MKLVFEIEPVGNTVYTCIQLYDDTNHHGHVQITCNTHVYCAYVCIHEATFVSSPLNIVHHSNSYIHLRVYTVHIMAYAAYEIVARLYTKG